MLDKLKEFLANIKAYFESINKNISEEARAMKESVGESVRYVENIVKLFDKAAIGAVENLQNLKAEKVETKKETVAETQETPKVEIKQEKEKVEEKPVEKPKTESGKTKAEKPKTQIKKAIVSNVEKIEDFGEKIGGARKDLWGKRGLMGSDLDAMNERERAKNVKKDNIWKRPDYRALAESGVDKGILFAVNEIRKSLPQNFYAKRSSTDAEVLEQQKDFISVINEIKTMAENIKTPQDLENMGLKWLVDNKYYVVDNGNLRKTAKYYNSSVLAGSNYLSTIRYLERNFSKLNDLAERQDFLAEKREIPKGYDIIGGKENPFKKNVNGEMVEDPSYGIAKGHVILKTGFATKQEAVDYLKSAILKKRQKTRFVPQQLLEVHRIGPDYRENKNVNGQNYLDTFGFKGGEFGNWLNGKDRQVSLNYGYDALKDLAYALQIQDTDISLKNNLSIAFGARGEGLSGAAAHYEKDRRVINLTKMMGAGSLAHEWFHALDDYIGGYNLSHFATENYYKLPTKTQEALRDLVTAMRYREATEAETDLEKMHLRDRYERYISRVIYGQFTRLIQFENGQWTEYDEKFSKRKPTAKDVEKFKRLKQNLLNNADEKIINELSALRKELFNHVISKETITTLVPYVWGLQAAKTKVTQKAKKESVFYKNSIKFDSMHTKDGDYWQSTKEMAARAFATYVADKTNNSTDYLTGHAESAVEIGVDSDGKVTVVRAYPFGEERIKINKAFDNLFKALKEDGYLGQKQQANLPKDTQYQRREYDTNGNKLSQKQSEYFADSLITDNNGNLKTVYHGSSKIFTKFDHSFIGEHGSMEGQGFYFTDKKEVAEGYQRKGGQLLEGYLNITKPLSDSEVTLQKAEVRKLLREIDPTGDDIIINYDSLGGLGYPSKTWYERALNDTVNSVCKYSETDSEILADISNSGGQRDVILKVRDILGYDGYIVKNKYDGADVYVAFDSNQFKLASNKNPTADEDIQLQRRENLTNREILELMTVSFNAEEMSQLTDAELDALEIFKKQTTEIYELQEMRLQEGAVFVENQFKKDGDRKLAQEAKNRVAIIDEKIKKATDRLMQIQEAEVIKKILPKARKIVGRYERIQTKQLASQYRKETREKINEVKEQAKAEKFDALARYRERMQNAATIKKYKERIEADVKELTKWIVSPDNKNYLKHVPDVLKDAVVPFLESIDFTSKRQLRGGEETIADKKFVKQLNTLMKAFKGTTDVEKMYSGYYDLPADFIENLQYFIEATQDLVGSVGGDHIINKMTAEELASLSKVVRALKHFIPQVNKFHNNAMYQHVYEAGDETISTLKKIKTSIAGALENFLFWKNTRPMDGFERMGKGARSIFLGLEKGQEQLAKNTKEIIDFTENAYTRKEVKEWEQELHTIEIEENGEKVTFQMTTSQIMGFYCLANQQDSLQHMDNGGIRIPTMKIKGKKYVDSEHKVSRTDIKNIISKLTDRQKAVADKLQKYMATKGAEWGNHVSVARFGEKLFTNPDYYPINSDGRHLESMADKELSGASLYALLNMSFTKSRNQLANNTILVYSIFDVFANHMASMAQYNAMALPVLDAIKWLNYEQKDTTAEGKRIVKGSVKGEMDRAFGVPEETKSSGKMGYAQSFVSNIIKSFNGTESFLSANDSLGLKALHIHNRAQIAFNLRVVVQQPLSIVRAGQIISYKSILKGLKASPKQAKANVEEMLNHSGIALWKSLGFYDVNVSRGLTSLIKHDETFIDKVTEAGMFLAEKADERTWAAMWSACKEEVIAKGTAPTDAKFFDKVNELFAEVIHKTQVVDSTLTKTEFMRDKGFWSRAMSSFMSEPITSASMVFNAFFKYRTDLQRGMSPKQAWENNKNNIGRTVLVYGLSATLLAVAQSFMDAARDDDDYETYLQKFGEALKSNVVDEASLLSKIPIVKNLLEFAKEMLATWTDLDIYGNEPPTVFAQWWDGFVKGSKILHDKITGENTNYTYYGAIFKLLQGVSGISGLPIANITREIVTLLNNTVGRFAPSLKIKSYDPGEKNSIKYAYRDGYLSEEEAIDLLVKQGMDKDDAYFFIQQEGKYDALYESILSGEGYAEAVEHLTEHGVTMDNITSTARSQIHKWLNEATITQDKAIELLVTYGELKKDVAQSRVEFWVVKNENNLEGFTEAAYNKYLKECAKSGMDVKVFYNAWQYKNEVDDKRKTLDYIYTLDIPQNQKRALIMCFY